MLCRLRIVVLQWIANAKNLGSSTVTSPKDVPSANGKYPRPSGLAGSIPAGGVYNINDGDVI